MKDSLRIARGLSLPLELVTQATGILAKRRAGKSFAARRIAEQLLQAGQQVTIVDPKGDWWGIRSSADGKAPGLPVIILGGERGDVKLEPGAGEVVAKLVVEERVSALLDLSLFRKHEVATFMATFLENLYRLKAREQFRTPMMLLIDEADAIAPQKPQKGEERMLGAAEDIVRRGGQRGIGCTLITQRSAVLNKNVLTQIQVLITLRTIAPQDLAALDAWIDVHGTPEERKALMESLPALPTGDAWVWSPGWPTAEGIFEHVHILPIETFDSGATPKPGEKRVEPKNLADVDLEALQRQMAATIERAKAEDPRELRKRIAGLEAELRKRPAAAAADPAALQRAREEGRTLAQQEMQQAQEAKMAQLRAILSAVSEQLAQAAHLLNGAARPAPRLPRTPTPAPAAPRPAPRPVVVGDRVSGGERKILAALAQYPQGRTKRQVAILTAYAVTGGAFQNYLGALRSKGYIEGRDLLRITESGLATLGAYDPLPTGRELLEHWLRQLGKAERLILSSLAEIYPAAMTKENLGACTGYEPSGGGFQNALGRLRTLELVEGRAELRASEELFV